jgi:hypothetical protein
MGGMVRGGAEFIAVAKGTWPSVGVGLFVMWLVCIEAMVAMED